MLEPTSKIPKTRRYLMFQEAEMLKAKTLSFGADTTNQTKDGQLSMLINQRENQPEDGTEISDSISTEYST
jgi:hypothetical protein